MFDKQEYEKNREFEAKITRSIAETCHFTKKEGSHFWICSLCGTRFHEHYYGAEGENERMLKHYRTEHLLKR